MPRLRSGEFAAELAHIVAQEASSSAEMTKIGRPTLEMIS
jgi:hypothetical protein